MEVLSFLQNLLGEDYGKILSVCKGGSWLYTKEGKTKICVPKLERKTGGQLLEDSLAYELLEEEVLFIETDRGLIVKEGTSYRFLPKGGYTLVWKR